MTAMHMRAFLFVGDMQGNVAPLMYNNLEGCDDYGDWKTTFYQVCVFTAAFAFTPYYTIVVQWSYVQWCNFECILRCFHMTASVRGSRRVCVRLCLNCSQKAMRALH